MTGWLTLFVTLEWITDMWVIRYCGATIIGYGLFETKKDALHFLGKSYDEADLLYSFHYLPVNEPETTALDVTERTSRLMKEHRLQTG